MRTEELDYTLPKDLVAQHPCAPRDAARMLVVDRAAGTFREDIYRNVATYLRRGDCMVMNDTRVIRARLRGHKLSGGAVELFLLHEEEPGVWTALARPSAKLRDGASVILAGGHEAKVGEVLPEGRRRVRFARPDVLQLLEEAGDVPLPPYIHRDANEASDAERYQTIYAQKPGAVAAPTAGLHFTPEVFASLEAAGIQTVRLTLHVGYGTFRPIQTDRVDDHRLESEDFIMPDETAATLNAVRASGGRIIAVGTTATRVLESQWDFGGIMPGSGATGHYIYPPYDFRAVDVLQTNFHLPKSSLLALVYAFGGIELIRAAYAHAIREKFRFYSYGDVMLIL